MIWKLPPQTNYQIDSNANLFRDFSDLASSDKSVMQAHEISSA
jgi:hypothetical protein